MLMATGDGVGDSWLWVWDAFAACLDLDEGRSPLTDLWLLVAVD